MNQCWIDGIATSRITDEGKTEWVTADPSIHVAIEDFYSSKNTEFRSRLLVKYHVREVCPYDGRLFHAYRKDNAREEQFQKNLSSDFNDLTDALEQMVLNMQRAIEALRNFDFENFHQHNWVDVTAMQDEMFRYVCKCGAQTTMLRGNLNG